MEPDAALDRRDPPGSSISQEEAERRLRQFARIWHNGAIRAVLAQRKQRASS